MQHSIERRTIVLPTSIEDHHFTAFYTAVGEMIDDMPKQPITLIVRGDGGSSRTALAMVDIINHAGPAFTGVMIGEANSSHGIIWAACRNRFVTPHAALGLHRIGRLGCEQEFFDAGHAAAMLTEYKRTELHFVNVFVQASGKSIEYWRELIEICPAGQGIYHISAHELVEMKMGAWITGNLYAHDQ